MTDYTPKTENLEQDRPTSVCHLVGEKWIDFNDPDFFLTWLYVMSVSGADLTPEELWRWYETRFAPAVQAWRGER